MSRSALHAREVREEYGLSRERLGRILRVSSKTVERWETSGVPPQAEARAVLGRLAEIARLGRMVYGEAGFEEFLVTPLVELDHRTPLQLLERGDLDAVLSMLAADYEGTGY